MYEYDFYRHLQQILALEQQLHKLLEELFLENGKLVPYEVEENHNQIFKKYCICRQEFEKVSFDDRMTGEEKEKQIFLKDLINQFYKACEFQKEAQSALREAVDSYETSQDTALFMKWIRIYWNKTQDNMEIVNDLLDYEKRWKTILKYPFNHMESSMIKMQCVYASPEIMNKRREKSMGDVYASPDIKTKGIRSGDYFRGLDKEK